MMETHLRRLKDFLVRAKRACYAGHGAEESVPSRPASHDFRYAEGEWLYIDSFLGSEQFAGEEAVWLQGHPIWAMNYCGHMLDGGVGTDFLRRALMLVPQDAPYRGPIEHQEGNLLYVNTYAGEINWFFGREEAYQNGVSVYECVYHGGGIVQGNTQAQDTLQ